MVHCIYTPQYCVCCRKGVSYDKTAGRNHRPLQPFKSRRRTGRREQQYRKSLLYYIRLGELDQVLFCNTLAAPIEVLLLGYIGFGIRIESEAKMDMC